MRIGSILESVSPRFAMMEGSHSGLVRPPAKRVGGVELPRGFESHSLRQSLPSHVVQYGPIGPEIPLFQVRFVYLTRVMLGTGDVPLKSCVIHGCCVG